MYNRPTTFLSLPREIRDYIYNIALCTTISIIVWSGQWICVSNFDDNGNIISGGTIKYKRCRDQNATNLTIQHLTVNLLRCNNSIVAGEAAMMFYTHNTFSFLGDHNWDPIVSWLTSIGAKNQGYIRRLDVSARRPNRAWQRSDGTRVRIPTLREELYPRNPYLCLPESIKEGEVENINPRIETLFSILCDRGSKYILELRLLLDPYFFPGLEIIESQTADHEFFTMDLLNLVEKFYNNYTNQCRGGGRIDILWIGKTDRDAFIENRNLIQRRNWEIIETKEVVDKLQLPLPPGYPPPYPVWKILFTLKRREQLTILIAEDPSPYSSLKYFD